MPDESNSGVIVSRPFRLNPKMACERCVFGTGEHQAECHVTVKENVQIPWTQSCGRLILDDRMPKNVIETVNSSDWTTSPLGKLGDVVPRPR